MHYEQYDRQILRVKVMSEDLRMPAVDLVALRRERLYCMLVDQQFVRDVQESGHWWNMPRCTHSYELALLAVNHWVLDRGIVNSIFVKPLFEIDVSLLALEF